MKILSKLKNIHFMSFMGTAGMSVLLFLFTAILYRSLSVDDMGIWFFFQTLLSFLDTFRQGFLSTAFVKFYSGSSEERGKEVIGSTWVIASLITLFFIVTNIPFVYFISYIHDASLSYFLKFYSLNLLCSLPMIISMCIVQGDLRFDRLLYIRIVQVLLLIIFLIALIFFKKTNLNNLMMANLAASLFTSIFTIIRGWSGIRFFMHKSAVCIKDLFDFGKFTVATSISSNLFSVTDTFIINFVLGPSALAVLNLGKRLMEIVEIPLRSFAATALPSISKAFNIGDKQQVIYIMKKYIGMITIALIPMLIIGVLFADVGMNLIGGGKYKGTIEGEIAVNVFRICALFSLLSPADRFMAVTLDAINLPKVNFMKIIVMLILNLVCDIIGVYLFKNIYGILIFGIFPTIVAILISKHYIQERYLDFTVKDIYTLGYSELKIVVRNLSQSIFKTKQ